MTEVPTRVGGNCRHRGKKGGGGREGREVEVNEERRQDSAREEEVEGRFGRMSVQGRRGEDREGVEQGEEGRFSTSRVRERVGWREGSDRRTPPSGLFLQAQRREISVSPLFNLHDQVFSFSIYGGPSLSSTPSFIYIARESSWIVHKTWTKSSSSELTTSSSFRPAFTSS